MDLLYIDLTHQQVSTHSWEDELSGGRLLTAALLTRGVDPGCDPLGPQNRLVLATGPLAGWGISCGGRLSVGAKSPLTGGIKESNAGGEVADLLANLGYRAVILDGAAPAGEPYLVIIEAGQEPTVRFVPGAAYWGLQLEETAARLRAGHLLYLSLESALSEHGAISQMPLDCLTLMTSGRRGVIDCGPFGSLEFTHTRRTAGSCLGQLVYDPERRLWIASAALAWQDLRHVGRNLDLVVREEVEGESHARL